MSENELFKGFQPQAIATPLKENPMTSETTKAKKPRKPRAAKAAKEPKPARKLRKAKAPTLKEFGAIKPVEPAISNLQTLFAAMKGLATEDHALFEKLLGASPAARKRVFTAIAKIFP